ncbi:MAG: GNAT family N-acetyltransferase [Chloroflexota bacterium]
MPKVEIRQVEGDEIIQVHGILDYYATSGSLPPILPDTDREKQTLAFMADDAICLTLYEDNQPQAYAHSTTMTQNVRGNLLPMSAIWDVGTHPAGRRKGYARQMMQAILRKNYEVGVAVSALYPFRHAFYERLGYVNFTQPRTVTFPLESLALLLSQDLQGSIYMQPLREGYDTYRTFLEQYQNQVHGMARRADPSAKLKVDFGWQEVWLAVAHIEDEVIGLMTYTITDDLADVTDFFFFNSQAKYLLLAWLARYIDQSSKARLRLIPTERPETWLADIKLQDSGRWPAMGRVVDVKGLNDLQVGEGAFSASIRDPHCDWNSAIFRFEAINGHLVVSNADQADCDLTIEGLSALVYGTNDPDDFSIRGWGQPSLEVQQTMRTMFPLMWPYLHEEF